MTLLFCFSILAVLAAFVQSSPTIDLTGDSFNPEKELRRNIFQGYDKYVRPVKKWTSAVPVDINMSFLRIRSMDEEEQIISLETWMKLRWNDEFLRWNPDDYNNITVLHVSPTEIWRPDIALYTATPDTSLFPTVHTNAIVFNNGRVLWVPPFTLNSRCPVPFRTHAHSPFVVCNIRLGSWTHSGKMLDLQLFDEQVDLTNFQDSNREWKLHSIVANRESKLYPCCPDEYPLVNYNLTMKKRNY